MRETAYEKALAAIRQASTLPPAEAIPLLVDCVKKANALAGIKAIKALAGIHHPSVAPALVALYYYMEESPAKRDNPCDLRMALAEALGDTGAPMAVDVLRLAIATTHVARFGPTPEDMAVGLRATAAIALAKIDPDCLHLLGLLLFDMASTLPGTQVITDKSPVRKAAAQGLSLLGGVGGAPLLAVKLKFPQGEDVEVLAECIESLVHIAPTWLMEIITPYLMGKNTYLATITAMALAETQRAKALPVLLDAFEAASWAGKEGLALAIGLTRCGAAREFLLEIKDHPNSLVAAGVAKGLEIYGE